MKKIAASLVLPILFIFQLTHSMGYWLTYDTELIVATKEKWSIEDIASLIDQNADVNKTNAWDNTPLIYAITYTPECMQLFIDHGADVNKEGMRTPLMYLVEDITDAKEFRQKLCILVQAGANPSFEKDQGESFWNQINKRHKNELILTKQALQPEESAQRLIATLRLFTVNEP